MIGPFLNMMSPNLFGTHLLYDDDVFAVVAVPPGVIALDIGVGILLPNGT